MEHRHLDVDGALRASYGVLEDPAWRGCPECKAAVGRLDERRAHQQRELALPEWFWQRQRQAVLLATLEPARPRWIGVAALAGVLVAALLVIQPAPKAPPRLSAEDERLFQEVSKTVNRVEPQALAPISLLLTQ